MATVAFSHFYKISLVPKVTKFIFYNISSSPSTLSTQKCFCKTKVCLLWEKNIFLMGNQKWQKKIEFEKLKSPKMATYQDLGFSTFQIQIFCHFWFPIKKKCGFWKQIYFCRTKKFLGRRRYIVKGRSSHYRRWEIL